MTIAQWIHETNLEHAHPSQIPNLRLDLQLIVAHALGISRTRLLTRLQEPVTPHLPKILPLLDRLLSYEPVPYITGKKDFYNNTFQVTPDTLIPRPETEHIIEEALALTPSPKVILDIGTGSGCIAVTLAQEIPSASVHATDISPQALKVAQINATNLNTPVTFHQSDLFNNLSPNLKPDLIVSNPPYVATTDHLPQEVKNHEPSSALYAQEDGYQIYRRLAEESKPLNPKHIILEIGINMAPKIISFFQTQNYRHLKTTNDLANIPRVLTFLNLNHNPLP